jgi:hypothetical protein
MLGPLSAPFLAAGDARADVQQPLLLDVLRAPFGVGEVRVAAVDDHVARRQQRHQLLDQASTAGPALTIIITLRGA